MKLKIRVRVMGMGRVEVGHLDGTQALLFLSQCKAGRGDAHKALFLLPKMGGLCMFSNAFAATRVQQQSCMHSPRFRCLLLYSLRTQWSASHKDSIDRICAIMHTQCQCKSDSAATQGLRETKAGLCSMISKCAGAADLDRHADMSCGLTMQQL